MDVGLVVMVLMLLAIHLLKISASQLTEVAIAEVVLGSMPRPVRRSFNSLQLNFLPWSVTNLFMGPKTAIQCPSMAAATVSSSLLGNRMTLTNLEKAQVMVRIHLFPVADMGNGPKRSAKDPNIGL